MKKKKRLGKLKRSLGRRSRSDLLRGVYILAFFLTLVAFGWGLYRVVVYAYESPALYVSSISVSGADRVSQAEVLARANFNAGSSILALDLDEMRQSIEAIDWVHHARVQRVWPREIAIAVVERTPIALARIDGEVLQVDAEGVLLPLEGGVTADAPILDGLERDDPEGNRARIQIYQETVGLIGESALSEVHISPSGEVSVVPATNPIVIRLGLDQHLERWERYLELSPRIRDSFPEASMVDLRYEDRVIIEQDGEQPVGTLPWEEETRLL